MMDEDLELVLIKEEGEVGIVNQVELTKTGSEKELINVNKLDKRGIKPEFIETIPNQIKIPGIYDTKLKKQDHKIIKFVNFSEKLSSSKSKALISKNPKGSYQITKTEPNTEIVITSNLKIDQTKSMTTKIKRNIQNKRIGKAKACVTLANKKQKKLESFYVTCQVCDRSFSSQRLLGEHRKRRHPETLKDLLMVCEKCGRKFVLKFAYVAHIKICLTTDTTEKQHFEQFQCDYCGKIFNKRGLMYNHVRCHLPPVQCPVCYGFVKQTSLQRHLVESHPAERKFLCSICLKAFKTRFECKKHEKIHEKRFQCNTCKRKFRHEDELYEHRKIHQDKIRNVVNDKSFSMKTETHRNKTIKRPSKKPRVTCPCPKYWANKRLLDEHMRIAHPQNILKCEACNVHFKSESSMKRHVKHCLTTSVQIKKENEDQKFKICNSLK